MIARNGTPVARLVPMASSASFASARGAWGRVRIADDFDAPHDDLGAD